MQFESRSVGRINIPKDRCIVLDHAQQNGVDYSGRNFMQFGTVGCRLEKCRFNNAVIECAQLGAGREQSEFIDCIFDGAKLYIGPGGYSRFVSCSFRDVEIRDWRCFAVEIVDCVFSGQMQTAIFNGTVPLDKRAIVGRDRNEFHGNDFSGMELIDVAFRTGVDLTQQRLPSGPDYLYIPDAETAVNRARLAVENWPTAELRQVAIVILKGIKEDIQAGQKQLFLRPDDYTRYSKIPQEAVDKVIGLLRSELL